MCDVGYECTHLVGLHNDQFFFFANGGAKTQHQCSELSVSCDNVEANQPNGEHIENRGGDDVKILEALAVRDQGTDAKPPRNDDSFDASVGKNMSSNSSRIEIPPFV